MARPAIVWFRQDLRLTDNPALHAAVARGATVVPLFIWAPDEEGRWAPGAAARWWLHQSLSALDSDLRALGSRLLLLRGPSLAALRAVLRQTGATAVFWNRRYEPAVVARDAEIERALRADGVEVESANAALLVEPWQVATKTGGPYQVFTPFWRACRAQLAPSRPLPRPQRLDAPTVWPPGLDLADLRLVRRELTRFADDRRWRDVLLQVLATQYSFVGRHQQALESFDKVLGRSARILRPDMLAGLEPCDAVQTILELADQRQVIMVNEAHHVPMHRAFTTQLLEALYRKASATLRSRR